MADLRSGGPKPTSTGHCTAQKTENTSDNVPMFNYFICNLLLDCFLFAVAVLSTPHSSQHDRSGRRVDKISTPNQTDPLGSLSTGTKSDCIRHDPDLNKLIQDGQRVSSESMNSPSLSELTQSRQITAMLPCEPVLVHELTQFERTDPVLTDNSDAAMCCVSPDY